MRSIPYSLTLSASMLLALGASAQVVPPTTPEPTLPPAVPTTPVPTVPPANPQAPAVSQSPAPSPVPVRATGEPYGGGMKVNLSPDGSKYLRFITWTQVWTRYTENNTGTLRAPAQPQESQVDFGLRRARFLILAQLNPRFLIISHIGINNQNAVSGGAPGEAAGPGKKPQIFFHDATLEYKVNKYLDIGTGLHYQNGISRMTRASTLNFLALDAPIVNWPTIDGADEFARFIGVYAKGRVERFNYAISANDPFLTNITSTPMSLGTSATTNGPDPVTTNTGSNVAQYNPQNVRHLYQGYFWWEFLEKEATLLPYSVGTYLGSKRVFNIGAGFLHNPDAFYSRPTTDVVTVTPQMTANPFGTMATRKHDMTLFGLDAFFDTPIDKEAGTAFTAYTVYYNYNMGPNHVRYVGLLNPGFGSATGTPGGAALRGNAVPVIGTGQAAYGQAGYLLPKSLLGPKARLQPYAGYLHCDWEGLRKSNGEQVKVNIVDVGTNLLLDGHNAKVTLNYRHRPDFTTIEDLKYRPEVTVQTVIFL